MSWVRIPSLTPCDLSGHRNDPEPTSGSAEEPGVGGGGEPVLERGRIGCITPAGVITEYDLPTPASEPHGIAVGPDGALWTALETGAIARLAP
jgi:hypothetical protein